MNKKVPVRPPKKRGAPPDAALLIAKYKAAQPNTFVHAARYAKHILGLESFLFKQLVKENQDQFPKCIQRGVHIYVRAGELAAFVERLLGPADMTVRQEANVIGNANNRELRSALAIQQHAARRAEQSVGAAA